MMSQPPPPPVKQTETSADGASILALAHILCALMLSLSIYYGSENIDIDNIYKIGDQTLVKPTKR